MDYKFEMKGYCEGCKQADLTMSRTDIFTDNKHNSSEFEFHCKHEQACGRIIDKIAIEFEVQPPSKEVERAKEELFIYAYRAGQKGNTDGLGLSNWALNELFGEVPDEQNKD